MGRRHKSKRGPKGTGAPDSAKDRLSHEAARGAKKLSLADLSKQRPTYKQLDNYAELTLKESDRGAAIMASALVEHALELAIGCRIIFPGEQQFKVWFSGDNAPFGTFSAKIQLGRAVGVYADLLHGQLTKVKNIRNQFAHCSLPLDFDHPTIVEAVNELFPDHLPPVPGSARNRYVVSCLSMAKSLTKAASEMGGQQIPISLP